ncbi:MAG: transcription antitermination factor NusB [bacterium]
MKTSTDPRHKNRILKVQALYSYSFQTKSPKIIAPIIATLPSLDSLIATAAPEWPLDNINRIDLAILRVATYELLHEPELPSKVAIDEAVEIAKTYGSDHSPAFVNGVLGNILKTKKEPKNAN